MRENSGLGQLDETTCAAGKAVHHAIVTGKRTAIVELGSAPRKDLMAESFYDAFGNPTSERNRGVVDAPDLPPFGCVLAAGTCDNDSTKTCGGDSDCGTGQCRKQSAADGAACSGDPFRFTNPAEPDDERFGRMEYACNFDNWIINRTSQVAAILVIARLCEPSSELYVAERWYERTALEDLLGVPADLINDDRLYRLLDHLVWHKSDIEHHLRKRLGELFAIEYDLLLYDVTSTYFEGVAARNEMARLGNSPRFLLDQLREIQSVDVALPLADDPQKEAKIRCVVRPEPAQAMLLDRLGLRLPQRLRIPSGLC